MPFNKFKETLNILLNIFSFILFAIAYDTVRLICIRYGICRGVQVVLCCSIVGYEI